MPDNAGQEAHWAAALEKSRQQQVVEQSVPLPVRQAHAKELWQRHKQGMLEAIEAQDDGQLEHHFTKAIAARADMMALFLQELRDQFTDITPGVLNYHMREYIRDCTKLAHAADTLRS